MRTNYVTVALCLLLLFLSVVTVGCSSGENETREIENLIRRYNDLVIQGYRNQDMNPLQEVATLEHALKLYHHMAALGEGKLRMEAKLKDIVFKKIDLTGSGKATVDTEEIWDFTHHRMATNEKYAEERDFIYRMGYILHKKNGRWIITEVNTIGGASTNTIIPLPQPDRTGYKRNQPADGGKPAKQIQR